MKLPLNCEVGYFAGFLSEEEADALYGVLIGEYGLDRARLVIEAGGELIETDSFKRLFLTEELLEVGRYPEGVHGKGFAWAGVMARLREKVEAFVGHEFELAMGLFYPDGGYYAAWHSDQETSGAATVLPSISLGAARIFSFRDKESGEEYSLELGHGSLLLMGEHCQGRYEHCLPKDDGCVEGRINVTFRERGFQ